MWIWIESLISDAPCSSPFHSVARLPAPDDNVAIAIGRIEAGSVVAFAHRELTLSHTVLEGHRFAVREIAIGQELLSWGLPFGRATRAIGPGDYVCNESMLRALRMRDLNLALPTTPNFGNEIEPHTLDEREFVGAPPVERVLHPRTFMGYRRGGLRGVGTRNYVLILGTTSRTASAARELARRLRPLARVHTGIDGIVAVSHTEGGGPEMPNNVLEIHRALAGFILHPNVGAVIALDHGVEPVNNRTLEAFMRAEGDGLDHVRHRFHTLTGSLVAGLAQAEAWVRGSLATVDAFERTPEPLSGLKIALQCGGSDAFSGISGNPLAGAVVHELIRHGGTGNLCETDELVGAEGYMLGSVRDLGTARALLDAIERFKQRLAWHGVTPEANPSAGNNLRGLYNIVLKSLGAAHKKDPRTRVDHVIGYGEPMTGPGFYFMNSPGNDLEGIAGQVAAGCNLFLFVTGNGSITNFPFVPTLKITTTTRRHQLLSHEMDVNAGRYLDGESMESLTKETFELVISTASGRRTQGEHAGHSQVSLWRNWRQTDTSQLSQLRMRGTPDGVPLLDAAAAGMIMDQTRIALPGGVLTAYPTDGNRWATERVGLIIPTSLCSTQIARMAAERLNSLGLGRRHGIARFVTLIHTEGCGFGGADLYELLLRTYRGYATHPNVAATLFLEHGCEKVPNDAMRRHFELSSLPLDRFGWASVQLDGGIDSALKNVEAWFAGRLDGQTSRQRMPADMGALAIALQSVPDLAAGTYETLATLLLGIVAAGGTAFLPDSDPLIQRSRRLREALPGSVVPSLSYGEPCAHPGLHLVRTETSDWSENLAGLAACGAHLAVTAIKAQPREGHPLIPVLQFAEASAAPSIAPENADGVLRGIVEQDLAGIVDLVAGVASQRYTPVSTVLGMTHFQLTRGLLGVST